MTETTTTDQRVETICGSLPGTPASGRPVQWGAVDIYRVSDDGQISEQRGPSWLRSAVIEGTFTLSWEGLRR